MKAMFVLHKTDPPEYFEILEKMVNRVVKAGGVYKVVKSFGERKGERRIIPHIEYHFECDTMGDLIDD
jgi:hypothetical protein